MNRTSAIAAAVAAIVTAGAVVSASYVSSGAVAIVVGAVAVLAAIGWPHLLGVPARKSQSAVIALSALLAIVLTAAVPSPSFLAWFPAAVSLGVGAVFMIQLIRGTGQSFRLESTLGASSGVLAVTMGCGWVAADRLAVNASDPGVMLVTGISLVVGALACLLPIPDRLALPAAVVLAALAGPLGTLLVTDVPALPAAVVGVACAVVLAGSRRLLLARETPLGVLAAVSAGTTPVLALGGVVYLLHKLLLR